MTARDGAYEYHPSIGGVKRCRACGRGYAYRRDALDDLTDEVCERGEALELCPWCLDEAEGLAADSPAFAAELWRPEDDAANTRSEPQ